MQFDNEYVNIVENIKNDCVIKLTRNLNWFNTDTNIDTSLIFKNVFMNIFRKYNSSDTWNEITNMSINLAIAIESFIETIDNGSDKNLLLINNQASIILFTLSFIDSQIDNFELLCPVMTSMGVEFNTLQT